MQPHKLTEEEVRERFLRYVRALIEYWLNESRQPRAKEKLEGLAFSILVALDGGSMEVPGFKVIPNPHPRDEQFNKLRGVDWFPNDCDIAGALHEEFARMK